MAGDAAHGIEHVIVVMLENRSFDHLLGFVDIPGSAARPGRDEHGHLLGCPMSDRTGARFFSSAEGRHYAAPLDPDHSHAAAMQQLGVRRRGPFRPDNRGFVASYLAKADGTSPELRDRIKERLWAVAFVTVVAALLQWEHPWLAAAWLGAAIVVVVTAWCLVWRGTKLSGYVPRTLLELVYAWTRSTRARVVLGIVVVGALALATLPWFGWTAGRAVDAVVLVAAAVGMLVAAAKVGVHQVTKRSGDVLERAVVNSMDPDEMEPITRLAQSFATCTRWFSSVPGETWPNRNFVHAGTSDGAVDIEFRLFDDETIFQRLHPEHSWAVYHRGVPQVLAFPWLWDYVGARPDTSSGFRSMERLWADLEGPTRGSGGTLPAYSFVEPFHGTELARTPFLADPDTTDSQQAGNNKIRIDHYDDPARQAKAGHDFTEAMHLVAEIYERLRRNPDLFAKTVLVITYDEHGGYFDHVPPPVDAVPPARPAFGKRVGHRLLAAYGMRAWDYDFTMLGPRVPTIIVSPRMPAGAVDREFDHTSIPHTVRAIFGLRDELSAREGASKTFEDLVSLTTPRTDLPSLERWSSDDPAAARHRRAQERARHVPPVADGFTRSLDLVAHAFLEFVRIEVAPEGAEAGLGEEQARRRAMRDARKAALRDVGLHAAARPDVTAG